jgi:hypothetical protein
VPRAQLNAWAGALLERLGAEAAAARRAAKRAAAEAEKASKIAIGRRKVELEADDGGEARPAAISRCRARNTHATAR